MSHERVESFPADEPPPTETPPEIASPPAAFQAAEAAGAVIAQPPSPEILRQQVREQLLAAGLPRGMRESLADSLATIATPIDGAGAQIPLQGLLPALQAALPGNWRTDPSTTVAQEHPAGESFFTGEGALTEQQASQIAREQLRRHGFLAAT